MSYEIPLPGPEHVVRFILTKGDYPLKKDWLVCSACGLPQPWLQGCCDDPECMPHAFKVDICVHCGFDQFVEGADPKAHDVEAGRGRMAKRWEERDELLRKGGMDWDIPTPCEEALEQYSRAQ